MSLEIQLRFLMVIYAFPTPQPNAKTASHLQRRAAEISKCLISHCMVECSNLYLLAVDECPNCSVIKQRGFSTGSPRVKLLTSKCLTSFEGLEGTFWKFGSLPWAAQRSCYRLQKSKNLLLTSMCRKAHRIVPFSHLDFSP